MNQGLWLNDPVKHILCSVLLDQFPAGAANLSFKSMEQKEVC